MNSSLPVIAGIISTIVFAGSTLPMLRKAAATKNLRSYSLGNIGLANVGNVVHSFYVFSLPIGPIWALHSFYLVSTGLMLFWYLRYAPTRHHAVTHFATARAERRTEARVSSEEEVVRDGRRGRARSGPGGFRSAGLGSRSRAALRSGSPSARSGRFAAAGIGRLSVR
jgi:hypothetical protein